jgi:hypothetical protein
VPDLSLGVLFAGVGLLVDRHQSYDAHQTAAMMPRGCVVVAFPVTCRLSRPITRRLQKLLINDCHKPQFLGALALRLKAQIGSRQRQQYTLPTHAQLMILVHHFLACVPSRWREASIKKSHPTDSCAILQCSLSTSAALTCSGAASPRIKAATTGANYFGQVYYG